MHKFTIFTLLLSATVVAIVSELIFNDYLKEDTFKKDDFSNNQNSIVEVQAQLTDPENQQIAEESAIVFKINEALVAEAGFLNVVLNKVDFSGKIFQLIELAGVQENEIIKFQIYEGETFVATAYEMALENEAATNETYAYLIANANLPNLSVNQSNTFGKSFYINNAENKKTVFLIVQKNSNLYGFEYPHASHTKIKALIDAL